MSMITEAILKKINEKIDEGNAKNPVGKVGLLVPEFMLEDSKTRDMVASMFSYEAPKGRALGIDVTEVTDEGDKPVCQITVQFSAP